jgi:hypothetical protein
MGLVPVALAVLLLQAAPGAANANSSRQQDPDQQQAAPSKPASSTAPAEDLFSTDHIRKELGRQPTLTFTMPDPDAPRFRVEIQGHRFELPDLRQRLATALPKSSVPVPLGGNDNYEMMRLTTPSQYWGSAPFTNGDLLKMSALTGAYGLAALLIRKGLEARESAAESRAREEVQQELAEVAAHNAQVAAGQPDAEGKDAKAAEKKKQDEKKKKKDGGWY